jgi:hypothetical protein
MYTGTAYGVLAGLKTASLLANVQYTVHFTANSACSLFVMPTSSLIPVRQLMALPFACVYPIERITVARMVYGIQRPDSLVYILQRSCILLCAPSIVCEQLTASRLALPQPTASTLTFGQSTASQLTSYILQLTRSSMNRLTSIQPIASRPNLIQPPAST